MILEWAAAGAAILAGFFFCFRLMKRGLTTLDEDRAGYYARIRAAEEQLREDNKNISLSEHLYIARAGLEDLLRLAGNPPGFSLSGQGQTFFLHTPHGPWRIALSMRERTLRGTRKVVHGRSCWQLSGFGLDEHFDDLASLMCSLNAHLRGDAGVPPEPPQFARRISQ